MLNRRDLCAGAVMAGVAAPASAREKRPLGDARTGIRSPGVYVEEIPSGAHAIDAAPTGRLLIVDRFGVAGVASHSGMSDFNGALGAENAHAEAHASLRLFFENGGRQALTLDVDPSGASSVLSPSGGGGLRSLSGGPSLDIDFIAIPCAARLPVEEAAAIYREALTLAAEQRAMLLIDPPPGAASASTLASDWFGRLGLDHPNTALYAPRLATPETGETIAPSGAVAGIIARTDAARGVWKAPAGTEAALIGAALAQNFSEADSNLLTQHNINAIREFTGRGPLVWGARTGSSDPEWKYVPVRRFYLFLEESISDGLQWAVFEPNGEPLWAKVRSTVETFLHVFFRQGAMAGAKAKDAYFVRCDRTTMTQNDIDNGRLNVLIGFAPLKPAEFVILNIRLQLMKP